MSSQVALKYSSTVSTADPTTNGVLLVGQLAHLTELVSRPERISCKFGSAFDVQHFIKGIESLNPSPTDSVDIWFKNFIIASLPSKASRHNAPMFPHSLCQLIRSNLPRATNSFVTIVCERSAAFALGAAVARSFPLYCRKKSSATSVAGSVTVEFVFVGQDHTPLSDAELKCLQDTADSIRLTSRIVDAPCNEMHTSAFVEEVRKVGSELGIEPLVIPGEELAVAGFGGLFGVGKAATHPPALAVLSHKPEGATKNVAWVGKGIVYDTGGLSIKDKTSMPGMKRDCGGAAAILGAFRAAVKSGFTQNLHAIFCLAENAVGPLATRPDDVHTLYSGLTVEINNTDAEGRLVLGDGVAYAKKDLKADIVLDMATLTSAQGVSTGIYHAAVVTNSESWENACVKAGRASGDLVHPLPYCPELHFQEFHSVVADMKNSVKDRCNALSSCAGLFIGAHLGFDFPGAWIHLDIAAPAEFKHERATGYGVALLLALFGTYSSNPLLQSVAPSV